MRVCPICVLVLACIVGTIGCEAPHIQARRALQTQLAVRRENQAKSMALLRKGQHAYASGNMDEARKCLAQAVIVDSQNAYAWMALGLVHYHCDHLYDAAAAFDKAAKLEPDRYEPQFNIGSVLETCGRYREAIQAYEKALHLAPDRVEVMENLARCYIRARAEPAKAKELVDKALAQEARPEWQVWLKHQAARLAGPTE